MAFRFFCCARNIHLKYHSAKRIEIHTDDKKSFNYFAYPLIYITFAQYFHGI